MSCRIVTIAATAAALAAAAIASAPLLIGAEAAYEPAGDPPHSWIAAAFPTGQAGFARTDRRP